MTHYSAGPHRWSYVQGRLLLSLLLIACTSIGYAEETSSRAEELSEVLGQALQAAREVQNPLHRRYIIDDIAAAYALVGNRDRALELAGREDNVNRNYTLSEISSVLVKQGQGHQAGEIISHITKDEYKAWALEELARFHIARGEHGEARERLDQAQKSAEGIVPDLFSTGIMLRIVEAQVAVGDRKNAEATLLHALELASTTEDAFVRDAEFSEVMQMQARLGDETGAWRTFEKIQNRFRKEIWINEIAVALAKGGNILRAIEVATSMEEDYFRVTALQRVAEAQAEAGDVDGALKTAGGIRRESHLRVIALGHIADTLVKHRNFARAQSVLSQAVEATNQISDRAELLGGLARRQAEINDRQGAARNIRQAIRALKGVREKRFLVHPQLAIVQAQVQAGDLTGALQLAAKIASDDFQDRAYCEITEFKAWAGDIKGAVDAAGLSHGVGRGYNLKVIAKIQAYKGDKKGALAWATTQTGPSDRALALLGVAEGLLHEGKPSNNCPKKPDYF
jgi:tetratricopeptide (TPR) repeat protein